VDPRDDAGIALVVAMMVMGLMLILGLAMLAVADTQTRESGVERVRESSFNLAEGALEQQSFLLGGKGWPRAGGPVPPTACTQASTSSFCPSPAALVPATGTGAYAGPDYAQAASWTTRVRDNLAARDQTYTDAVDARPTWDQNGDGFLWVRSSATVAGRTRSIVALLKRDPIPILLPKAALVAGALVVGQNGQSPVISTDGTSPPVLRCPGYGPGCAEYIASGGKKAAQIAPDTVSYSPPGLPEHFVPQDTVAKLMDSATTHTGCPSPQGAQGIVVIDVPEGTTCTYTSNTTFNSPALPGVIIMRRGTLSFAGSGEFHGLLLHLNEAGRIAGSSTPECIRITGTFDVYGGVIIEGRCGLYVQGNARLSFAPNNLNFSLTGVAGIVQNTWRELTG
jgi:hypothetical protein